MTPLADMPTADVLRDHFSFDPDTGDLLRNTDGKRVGYINNIGYRQVYFRGRIHSAHRLIWMMHFGEAPHGEVDHINGDRSDNRVANLRLATSAQNNQNRRLSSRNKTGVKGVFKVKHGSSRIWRVDIGHSCGHHYITHFHCFGKAVRHANETRSALHKDFANTGVR